MMSTSKDEFVQKGKTLNREEWIAVLVQMVLTRHVLDEGMAVGNAFDTFFAELRSRLPPLIQHDSNEFRSAYCYPEAIDFTIKQYERSLSLVFDVFAYGDGAVGDSLYSTKLMDISEYNLFIDRVGLIDQYVTARDVEHSFSLCRMLVIDEGTTKGRARLLQLRFEDFLECIVRLAYHKPLPTDAQVLEQGCKHAGEFLFALEEEPEKEKRFHEARRWSYDEPPDQPIKDQVRHFVEWLLYRVRGGEDFARELSRKDVQLFRDGHRAVKRVPVKTGAAPAPVGGGDADDQVEYMRVGGPDVRPLV